MKIGFRNITPQTEHENVSGHNNKGRLVRSVAFRSDGYHFYLTQDPSVHNKNSRSLTQYRVSAGCREAKSFRWWRNHIKNYYRKGKRDETRRIIDLFEHQITKARSW